VVAPAAYCQLRRDRVDPVLAAITDNETN